MADNGILAWANKVMGSSVPVELGAVLNAAYGRFATALTTVDGSGNISWAGTQSFTGGALTGVTIASPIESDFKVLAATATASTNVIAATLTGFSWTVAAAGTYLFEMELPATMTTNGGLTVSYKLTTATLTSIRYSTYASTATDNGTAVSTTGTTTTDATKVFDSATAAYTRLRVWGSMVVNAGGTFAWQFCQNTSHSDTTSVLIGSYAKMTRVL